MRSTLGDLGAANAIGMLGYVSAFAGHGIEALRLVDAASRECAPYPILRARLLGRQAPAAAADGDLNRFRHASETAMQLLIKYRNQEAPPFLYYLAPQQLAAEAGQGLGVLAERTSAPQAPAQRGDRHAHHRGDRSRFAHRDPTTAALSAFRPASSSKPAQPVNQTGPIEIVERTYDHPDAVRLLQRSTTNRSTATASPTPLRPTLPGTHHRAGCSSSLTSTASPAPAAAIEPTTPATATVELKKLYTVPELRGRGLGRLVGARLEQHAADYGARRAILETGMRSRGALALIRLAGYQPTARYVAGRDPAINRALVKDLSDLNHPSSDSP